MIVEIKKPIKVDARFLQVRAHVRYWEDAHVDGIEDTAGDLVPCREGEDWCPLINIDDGRITNWGIGITADIHYKICDDGMYKLLTNKLEEILSVEGYVPDCMCPKEDGCGDYIIMDIDEHGYIKNWSFDISTFN